MLLRSPFRRLQDLVASPALDVGDVVSLDDGILTIDLIGGGHVLARGTAGVGDRVFVRGGVVEGPAPALPMELIDV